MAGGRVFGGSNMAVILQNEGISSSAEALHTLLFSSSSPTFSGSRTMVHFQDVHAGKKTDRSFLQLLDQVENGDEDMDEGFHQPEKKRRLTTDQVQFLEKSFEVEIKLEPERKIQLAKDLGLQPRQVAIWFQNRRARWKTKQLEKDYEALKASYNSLKSDCDNLLKEKDKLKDEIDCLNKKLHLKEEGKGNSDQSNPDKPSQLQSQKPILDSTSEAKESSVPIVICKQEDLSSAKSDIFDSADSSQVVEPDLSDISQDEEDNLNNSLFLPSYSFPKLEDADYPDLPENSCNLGFPVGDQPLWFWSY